MMLDIKDVMAQNRFKDILQNLHFSDYDKVGKYAMDCKVLLLIKNF